MVLKRKTVGSYIVTRCSKCDNDMNHVITALNPDGSVVQVKCMVCSSIHKPIRQKKLLASPRKTIKTTRPSYSLFNQAKESATNKVPMQYNMSKKFDKNILIIHSQMGEGVILNSYENKIDVLFLEGRKVLVHNR